MVSGFFQLRLATTSEKFTNEPNSSTRYSAQLLIALTLQRNTLVKLKFLQFVVRIASSYVPHIARVSPPHRVLLADRHLWCSTTAAFAMNPIHKPLPVFSQLIRFACASFNRREAAVTWLALEMHHVTTFVVSPSTRTFLSTLA